MTKRFELKKLNGEHVGPPSAEELAEALEETAHQMVNRTTGRDDNRWRLAADLFYMAADMYWIAGAVTIGHKRSERYERYEADLREHADKILERKTQSVA